LDRRVSKMAALPARFIVTALLATFCWRLKSNFFAQIPRPAEASGDNRQGALLFAVERLSDLVIICGFLTLIQTFVGLSLQPLFAVGGIGGLAIGFASQDLVANLFGGLFIYLATPFGPGDEIQGGDGVDGRVLSTNWYSTTLIDTHNNEIVAPNSTFTRSILVNKSRRTLQPFLQTIEVPSSLLPQARLMTFEIRQYLRDNPVVNTEFKPRAYVTSYTPDALTIDIRAELLVDSTSDAYQAQRQMILLSVARIVEAYKAKS